MNHVFDPPTSYFLLIGEVTGESASTALIRNDAVIFGILMTMLAFVFWTSSRKNQILENVLHDLSDAVDVLFLAKSADVFRCRRSRRLPALFCRVSLSVAGQPRFVDVEHRSSRDYFDWAPRL